MDIDVMGRELQGLKRRVEELEKSAGGRTGGGPNPAVSLTEDRVRELIEEHSGPSNRMTPDEIREMIEKYSAKPGDPETADFGRGGLSSGGGHEAGPGSAHRSRVHAGDRPVERPADNVPDKK